MVVKEGRKGCRYFSPSLVFEWFSLRGKEEEEREEGRVWGVRDTGRGDTEQRTQSQGQSASRPAGRRSRFTPVFDTLAQQLHSF